MRKKDEKGFTLVELIVTIIIISLIFIISFPSLYRILKDNDSKQYDNYYKLVREAAYVYADTRKDILGGEGDSGCTIITVSDLIEQNFLKEFDNDDGQVSQSKILMRNKKGEFTIEVYIDFIDYDNKHHKIGSVSNESCNAYEARTGDTLKNKYNGVAISGSNNYVWYSGSLWRVIDITPDGEAQLVANDIVSTIPFSTNGSNMFKGSYIETWLNNKFLNTLYNHKRYVSFHKWQYDTNLYVTDKVGLMNASDFQNYLVDTTTSWTLSKINNDVKVIDTSNVNHSDPKVSLGVKPSIFIKKDVFVIAGNGTISNPYQFQGNQIKTTAEVLNSRNIGEYVKIDNILYRIVDKKDKLVKLVSVDPINLNGANVDLIGNDFTLTSVYKYLNETWLESFRHRNRVVASDWCLASKSKILEDVTKCGSNNDQIKSFKVGIPYYTELFANGTHSNNFITMTYTSEGDSTKKDIVVGADGKISYMRLGDSDHTPFNVKVSFYMKEIRIKSGTGTFSDPFMFQ